MPKIIKHLIIASRRGVCKIMQALNEMEIDKVAGGSFASGVGDALDNAGRGALIGGTLGMALGPGMGAMDM